MPRPAPVAIASATLLIVAGIPFWGVKFVSVNASVLPTTTTARQVDDARRSGCARSPGQDGPSQCRGRRA